MSRLLTPDGLRDLLATLLEGAAGGTHEHWSEAIGPVEQLTPLYMHVRGNWRVHPKGSDAELDAIAKAVELVRTQHPYVLA